MVIFDLALMDSQSEYRSRLSSNRLSMPKPGNVGSLYQVALLPLDRNACRLKAVMNGRESKMVKVAKRLAAYSVKCAPPIRIGWRA